MMSKKGCLVEFLGKAAALMAAGVLIAGVFSSCAGPVRNSGTVSADSQPPRESADVSSNGVSSPSSAVTASAAWETVRSPGIPASLCAGLLDGSAPMLNGIGRFDRSVKAKDPKKTLAKVAAMLKPAAPFSGELPPLSAREIDANDYVGPFYLTAQTRDGLSVDIRPIIYFTTIVSNKEKTVSKLHYVENVLSVTAGGKTYYIVSQALYGWLTDGRCETEFMAE